MALSRAAADSVLPQWSHGIRLDIAPGMVELVAILLWCATALALVAAVLRVRAAHHSEVARSQPQVSPDQLVTRRALAAFRAHTAEVAGFIFLAVAYRGILAPGISLYGDWVYLGPRSALANIFTNPSLWASVNLGSSNFIGLPQYPLWGLESLLARVGLSVSDAQRAVFLVPIPLLSYVGVLLLARRLRFSPWAGAVGGVIYAGNTFFVDWYSGGWLTILLGYALLPWVALAARGVYWDCTLKRPMSRVVSGGAVFGLIVGLLTWTDPRQPVELAVGAGVSVVLLLLAGVVGRAAVVRCAAALCVAGAVAVALNLTWILPAAFGASQGLPVGYTAASALREFSYMNISNAIGLFDVWWPQMHYFVHVAATPLVALVVPGVVLLAVLRATRLCTVVAAASYLVFSVLVTGANAPFGPVNLWLFQRVPSFSAFRYPALYEELVVLAVAILVPPVLEDAWLTLRRYWHGYHSRDAIAARLEGLVGVVCSLLLLPYVVSSPWPAATGALGHMLAPRPSMTGASMVQNYLLAHAPAGTVLWSPVLPPTASQGVVSPSGAGHPNVSAVALTQEAMPGEVYQSGILWWLGSTAATGEVLRHYHIRYVVLEPQHYWSGQDGVVRSAALSTLTRLSGVDGTGLRRAPGYRIYRVGATPDLEVFSPLTKSPPPSIYRLAARYTSGIRTDQSASSVGLMVRGGRLYEVLSAVGSTSKVQVYSVAGSLLAGIGVSWDGHNLFLGVKTLEGGVRLPEPSSSAPGRRSAVPVIRLVEEPPGATAGWGLWAQCSRPIHVAVQAERPIEGGTSSQPALALLQVQVTDPNSERPVGVNFQLTTAAGKSSLMPGLPQPRTGPALSSLVPTGSYAIRPLAPLFGGPLPSACSYRARLLPLGAAVKFVGVPSAGSRVALPASPYSPEPSLGPWQELYNGDNYTHAATLTRAGIAVSVSGRPSQTPTMCMHARVDAATVSAPWLDTSLGSIVDIRVQYSTSPGAVVTVSFVPSGEPAPVVTIYLPSTKQSSASDATIPVFLLQQAAVVQLYSVVVSAVSAGSGGPGFRPNCTATVSAVSVVPGSTVSRGPLSQPVSFRIVSQYAGEATLRLPAAKTPQLIALWQNYSSAWHLAGSRLRSVRPIRLDGWADGFVIPAHTAPEVVQLQYSATDLVRWGLYLSYLFLAAVLLAVWIAGRRGPGGA